MEKRILVVDDDADVLAGFAALLAHAGWEVSTATSGREALRAFDQLSPDVILLDVMLPDMSGIDILDQIKSCSEETPVVMMSGVGTIDVAVKAMKLGAETFVAKPCDFDNLELVLENVSRLIATRRQLTALKRSPRNTAPLFVGTSKAAVELSMLIDQVAPARSPVLLLGESGSGKGMVARLIHQHSSRGSAPFVDLNCAGLSRELLESELFGHERGAFTDARTTKQGLFEIAAGGTIFLDEIAELEPQIQAKLLKAIEDKRFRRVGGIRDISVDARLVAATNRNLPAEVSEGRFRKDLYYRLNVVTIRIPSLRERIEDLPLLVERLLADLGSDLGVRPAGVSARALRKLMAYSWPGNVRELRNVLERALIITRGRELRVEDLLLDTEPDARDSSIASALDIRPLDSVVSDYVRLAVGAVDGNIRAAARLLEVSPSTIYARLKQVDAKPAETPGREPK